MTKTRIVYPDRRVATSADDTERAVPEDTSGLVHTHSHFPTQRAEQAIDSFAALQIGLWGILTPIEMFSIDLEALLAGKQERRKFVFERVFFDWAEMEQDRVPHNSVVIRQASPTIYLYPSRDTVLLEDTADVYCEGTILKRLYTAEVDIFLEAILGNKDDRGGVRRGLEDAFDEMEDERAGRRVVVPQYYDRTARYSLTSIDYPDSSDFATDNSWPVVARLKADIDVVKLVKRPNYIRHVGTQVVTTDEEIG